MFFLEFRKVERQERRRHGKCVEKSKNGEERVNRHSHKRNNGTEGKERNKRKKGKAGKERKTKEGEYIKVLKGRALVC